jgi:hypothetical protein
MATGVRSPVEHSCTVLRKVRSRDFTDTPRLETGLIRLSRVMWRSHRQAEQIPWYCMYITEVTCVLLPEEGVLRGVLLLCTPQNGYDRDE